MDFHRQKINLPTNKWSDLLHHAHDRAFVVAGAKCDALLADFHSAIEKSIDNMPFKGWTDKDGQYQKGFLDHFDEIVARHGWDYNGGRDWRARTIYETNLKSAYAAGRYKQMTDPAVKAAFPFWKYVHGLERIPANPREQHLHWDGMVLRADDEWWLTYYPPNGWKCGCGVMPVSEFDLKAMGKTRPDNSPKIRFEKQRDPATDDWMDYPVGVDMGWAYAPGRTWADGIIPKELRVPLKPSNITQHISQLPAPATAPSTARLLQSGDDEANYLTKFLSRFGAAINVPKLFRDKAGHVIPVSDELFRAHTGELKIKKSGREQAIEFLADTLIDPDEIWIDFATNPKGQTYLVRRYLRYFEAAAGFASFSWTSAGWHQQTIFDPKRKNGKRPDFGYLTKYRKGALLYKREKKE